MDKYIKVYDNVLSKDQCLHYISLINNGQRNPGRFVGADGAPTIDERIKKSEDITISVAYPKEIPHLMQITANVIKQYEVDVDCKVPCFNLELFRGRVYRENEGHYGTHIDVAKPITYGRMITIIFYLNTIEKGGELYFENQDVTVKAVEGRVICFPSYWCWRHQAKPSLKGDRYIIRTFAKGP